MPGGFLPSPEKDYVQKTLWLQQIRKAFRRNGGVPLTVLCLPGRECRFLDILLRKGFVTLETVTCIERDKTESLIIRGKLAEFSTSERRMPASIIDKSAYDFLTQNSADAIARRFAVIDLDTYGRVAEEHSELLNTTGAAVSIQARADMPDWLLFVTTEIASTRHPGIAEHLKAAEVRVMADEGALLKATLERQVLRDKSLVGRVRRFAAGAGVWVARAALPHYRTQLLGVPLLYRATDDLGRPGMRALMGAFAFRLVRPEKPLEGMARQRKHAEDEIAGECAKAAARCRGVLADDDGNAIRTDDLEMVIRADREGVD